MGTGIYLDDVDAALERLDAQQLRTIRTTMWSIAAIAILSVLLVDSSTLALNIRAVRVAGAKLKTLATRVVASQEEERARLEAVAHFEAVAAAGSAARRAASTRRLSAPARHLARPLPHSTRYCSRSPRACPTNTSRARSR